MIGLNNRFQRTGNVESRFGAAQRDAGGDVGGDAAERAGVQRSVDTRDVQIAVDLVSSTGVGQLATVQRPVEHDLASVGHVAAQQRLGALDHVLVDRRRVEVEAVLLLGLGHR